MARPPIAREKLLDAAEALFAEHGLEGVSLRTINAEAGLSPGALHYHFGSKQALFVALLERRMPALMARRAELLEALMDAEEVCSARDVLDAFIRPLVELMIAEPIAGLRYVRFVERAHSEGDVDERFVLARHQAGIVGLDPLLQRALPELPVDLVRLRLAFAIDSMMRSLSNRDFLIGQGPLGGPDPGFELFVTALVDYNAGGMSAQNHIEESAFRPAGLEIVDYSEKGANE